MKGAFFGAKLRKFAQKKLVKRCDVFCQAPPPLISVFSGFCVNIAQNGPPLLLSSLDKLSKSDIIVGEGVFLFLP